jgi:ParB family chromosome partitioning protein
MNKSFPSHAAEATSLANPSAVRPRASFSAASFDNLRAAAGEGQGAPLRILVVDIDEDPDQPRTVFDDDELQSMAESIRTHGVVQPIVVRPPMNGRYRLAFGARRLRATRLAGVADIPAVIRPAEGDSFATQIIENQQRSNLTNSELATAIARLAADGSSNKQIAAICSLKDYQVAAFRQVDKFPEELVKRMDSADMRALYDLFRQWTKTPEQVVAALADHDAFVTVTEARRIIGRITGKPTGSIVLDRPPSSTAPASTGSSATTSPKSTTAVFPAGDSAALDAAPTPALKPPPTRALTTLSFIVAAADGPVGRLVLDRRGKQAGTALVAYDSGVEEVEVAALKFVGIE